LLIQPDVHSMTTPVIKSFPDDLHARLKDQARRHHRSVTTDARRRRAAPS
jgi:plasmid stability protein